MGIPNKTVSFTGLGTITFAAPQAGLCFVQGQMTIPTIVGGGGQSSVVVTVNKNGSPVYTGTAGAQGFYCNVLCGAASDVITVVTSSSAAADLPFNVIQGSISCGAGE